MLTVERKGAGVYEEFGLVSTYTFTVNRPFLLVEKYKINPRNLYHITRWLTHFDTFEGRKFAESIHTDLDKTFFRYKKRDDSVYGNITFGRFPCIKAISSFNIADFIAELLPLSCAIKDLPLEEIREELNGVYWNYPKPDLSLPFSF
ncbi:hypothetical protein HYS95_03675 [Candidatus Daviesbacteria bacterium]|nr:hypothetical protein [Candidatus Daviesbacteria bacterium]